MVPRGGSRERKSGEGPEMGRSLGPDSGGGDRGRGHGEREVRGRGQRLFPSKTREKKKTNWGKKKNHRHGFFFNPKQSRAKNNTMHMVFFLTPFFLGQKKKPSGADWGKKQNHLGQKKKPCAD